MLGLGFKLRFRALKGSGVLPVCALCTMANRTQCSVCCRQYSIFVLLEGDALGLAAALAR